MSERTSPILSLPNELLEAITAAGQNQDGDPASHMSLRPEWILSRVSSRLREVIIGAPSLWTRVVVHLDLAGSVEISKLYLERSGGRKIWITLCANRGVVEDRILAKRLSDLILPHVNRARRLDLASTFGGIAAPFQNVAAPHLEHLEIEDSAGRTRRIVPINVFSSGAPRLTVVKWTNCILLFPVPQWISSLTHLDLRRSVDEEQVGFVFAMLAQCPSLNHLYIDASEIILAPAQIYIPSLRSLYLDIRDDSECTDAIHLFDTPGLTDLILDGMHGDWVCALFNITSPHASFPALTSLSFLNNGCHCEDNTYISSDIRRIASPPLRLFPALTSLTLINQCFTPSIVFDILGPDSQPWPLLQTVTLCHEFLPEDVYRTLQQILLRQHQQALPKFRVPSDVFHKSDWQQSGVVVELVDPEEVRLALDSS
ncbi:hypothetical protein B0H11DRAFT_2185674 [Mycena galericulata]|nr:hypothetical protein B0H11DRAFT_2185674 [Mycena galericulata]